MEAQGDAEAPRRAVRHGAHEPLVDEGLEDDEVELHLKRLERSLACKPELFIAVHSCS